MAPASTTTEPTTDEVDEDVENQIHQIIKAWVQTHPDRITLVLPSLGHVPEREAIMERLARYNGTTPIEGLSVHRTYALHIYPFSGRIVAVLSTPLLRANPREAIAYELAELINEASGDEPRGIFEFEVPGYILDLMDQHKARGLRNVLPPYLRNHDLAVDGGNITGTLRIRRNR